MNHENQTGKVEKGILSNVASTDKQMLVAFLACLFLYIPLGTALAWLVPDNIMDNPEAKIFTDFMSLLFPRIREAGLRASVPATQFIMAVMTVMASSTFILFSIVFLKRPPESILSMIENELGAQPLRAFLKWFIFLPLFSFTVSLGLYFDRFRSYKGAATLHSQWMMGTYGSILTLGMCMSFAAGIVLVKACYTIAKRRISRKA